MLNLFFNLKYKNYAAHLFISLKFHELWFYSATLLFDVVSCIHSHWLSVTICFYILLFFQKHYCIIKNNILFRYSKICLNKTWHWKKFVNAVLIKNDVLFYWYHCVILLLLKSVYKIRKADKIYFLYGLGFSIDSGNSVMYMSDLHRIKGKMINSTVIK